MVDVRQTCGLNRFMKAFEGISNRMYGTKLRERPRQDTLNVLDEDRRLTIQPMRYYTDY